jgi:peptide chain release factor 1
MSAHPTSTPSGVRIEIRPGNGGTDAEEFATELADALCTYATRHQLHPRREVTPTRTVVISVRGDVHRWERFVGVHRVQRIPRSSARGRRHTSTATVAAIPVTAAPTAAVDLADVRIDTFRGTGPGGQHRNKTDSSVRALHVPTGTMVTVLRGRSQHQNRATALTELVRRLESAGHAAAAAATEQLRTAQIAGGAGQAGSHLAAVTDAKAFTYNTQRNEVIEHATGSRHALDRFLRGHLDA